MSPLTPLEMELLAALKALLVEAQDFAFAESASCKTPVFLAAEAAIAKAEGQ